MLKNTLLVLCLFAIGCKLVIGQNYRSKINYRRQKSLDDLQDLNNSCDNDGSEYRLPRSVTPVHYNVTWRPDLESLTFDGEESILLTINQANITTITLHVVELDVQDVAFVGQSSKGIVR